MSDLRQIRCPVCKCMVQTEGTEQMPVHFSPHGTLCYGRKAGTDISDPRDKTLRESSFGDRIFKSFDDNDLPD